MTVIETGRIIAGKYRLEETIAGGGMGSIWRGYDLHLEAPVAVKFMRPEFVEKEPQRARFEREAKAAAKIRSPHIVHTYDHGIDQGTPYIVMELLEGEDLGRRLRRERQLPLHEAVRICTEICRGLHRAHRRSIVHRDLKPGNVFLSAPDDDLVKLLDFGIVKAQGVQAAGAEITSEGQLLGSPHYMSPEQVRGIAVDGRSDLWSLGVILYRALTGHHPFRGVEIGDLIVRICTDPVAPPSSLRPGLGSAMDRFFERVFQKEPGDRFQDAKELASAFAEAAQCSVPVGGAALAESSWDSAESPEPLQVPTPDPLSTDGGGGWPGPPVGPPGVGRLLEPTPTAASHTLPSELAARRPPPRWPWLLAVAGIAVVGTVAAWLATSSPSSAPAAADGPPALSRDDGAAAAEPLPPPPSSEASSDATDAGAPSPRASATVAPPRRPPPSRPTVRGPPRPAPTPAPTKTAAPYKPSDLGY